MTILMSISLLSVGVSIGFVIAGLFSGADVSVGAVVSSDDLKPKPTEERDPLELGPRAKARRFFVGLRSNENGTVLERQFLLRGLFAFAASVARVLALRRLRHLCSKSPPPSTLPNSGNAAGIGVAAGGAIHPPSQATSKINAAPTKAS